MFPSVLHTETMCLGLTESCQSLLTKLGRRHCTDPQPNEASDSCLGTALRAYLSSLPCSPNILFAKLFILSSLKPDHLVSPATIIGAWVSPCCTNASSSSGCCDRS